MSQSRHCGRRNEERDADFLAEERGRCVASRAVDEDSGPEEDFAVGLVVVGFRYEVISRAEIVGPCFLGDLVGGELLDVVKV